MARLTPAWDRNRTYLTLQERSALTQMVRHHRDRARSSSPPRHEEAAFWQGLLTKLERDPNGIDKQTGSQHMPGAG